MLSVTKFPRLLSHSSHLVSLKKNINMVRMKQGDYSVHDNEGWPLLSIGEPHSLGVWGQHSSVGLQQLLYPCKLRFDFEFTFVIAHKFIGSRTKSTATKATLVKNNQPVEWNCLSQYFILTSIQYSVGFPKIALSIYTKPVEWNCPAGQARQT